MFSLLQIIGYRKIVTGKTGVIRVPVSVRIVVVWLITIFTLIGTYRFFQSVEQSARVQQTLGEMGFVAIKTLKAVDALGIVALFIAMVFFLLPSHHLSKRWTWGLHILAGVIIFLLTIGIPKLNLYDYTHYAGPIHDILMGNPPLATRSWYGFLPIILLSLLFRVIPLTAASLHVAVTLIHYLGFLLYYTILRTVLRDARWALVGTVYAIFGSHLVMIGGINEHPQNTFIRMGAWIVVALSILYRPLLSALPMTIVALSLFWTLDAGLYTLMAYVLFMFFLHFGDRTHLLVKRMVHMLGGIAGLTAMTFLLINLVSYIFYQKFPMWLTHYLFIGSYQASSHMLPVPNEPWLWMSILIPAATIAVLMTQMKRQQHLTDVQSAVLFIAFASLTYFNYFLGRTTLNALHTVILPILVCAFYLLKIGLDRIRTSPMAVTIASVILAGTILGVPGTLLVYDGIGYLKVANPGSTLQLLGGGMPDEYDWFGPTVQNIQKKYGKEVSAGKFTLLSMWDTWYLLLLHTTNRVGITCQLCYVPDEHVDFQVSNIRQSPSPYLFADHQRTRYDYGGRVEDVLSRLKSEYYFVETVGLLDVYKRN